MCEVQQASSASDGSERLRSAAILCHRAQVTEARGSVLPRCVAGRSLDALSPPAAAGVHSSCAQPRRPGDYVRIVVIYRRD